MAVKNAAAKNWVITPSFDGYLYSAYPNGDKPSGYQTAPTLLFTDIVAGPTSGGENNKGCYLTLYGYSFGRLDQMGTASGARVYIGGVEVDNYRFLRLSKTYAWNQIIEMCVQVGALGGASGALDVKVTVNGVDSNTITGGFYVQPGRIAFVSQSGSDATGLFDTISSPFRYIQDYAGGVGSPVAGSLWAATTAQGEVGFRGGDFCVLRGGTWVDRVGYDGNWWRFKDKTGTVPNGVAGQGYMTIQVYPGPALGNAPEEVIWASPSGGGNKGGIQGAGGDNAALGYGRYCVVSGIVFTGVATSGVGGLVNLQSGANYWRVVGCEMGPWPSTADARVGGVAGNGDGVKLFGNYIHDISADPTPGNLNHGLYFDGSNSGAWDACAKNCEAAYNVIKNINNGSSVQYFNQDSSDVITGMSLHHNWLEVNAKYAINLGQSCKSVDVYNNVTIDSGVSEIRWDTPPASIAHNISHNTFIHGGASTYAAVINTGGNITSGTLKIQHNIVVLSAGRGSALPTFLSALGASNTAVTISENLYKDFDNVRLSVPTEDATGVYGDPLFVDVTTDDYTCGASGAGRAACLAAEIIAVATDYYGIARPVTGVGAPGATKNDIGAMQGTGT